MAELEYFAANDPLTFKRRGGRVLTAGVLLVLAGLGVGVLTALLGITMYRYLRDLHRELLSISTVWLTLATCAAALLAAGVGLLMRRRWSLPVARVSTMLWLTFGVAIVATNVTLMVVQIAKEGGVSWHYLFAGGNPSRLFWRLLVPLGTIGTLTLGLPGLIFLLLRPDDVRRTLELHDVRQRWTDGRSARRGAAVANFVALAGTIGWFVLVDRDYAFDDRQIYFTVPCVVAALTALGAAACAVVGRRGTDWAALTLAVGVITTLAYVGVFPHPVLRYVYSDKAMILCVFVVAAAIATMLLAREVRNRAADDATTRTQ